MIKIRALGPIDETNWKKLTNHLTFWHDLVNFELENSGDSNLVLSDVRSRALGKEKVYVSSITVAGEVAAEVANGQVLKNTMMVLNFCLCLKRRCLDGGNLKLKCNSLGSNSGLV